MGQVFLLHGGDDHGMDVHTRATRDRVVPEALSLLNVDWCDMRTPAGRGYGFQAARTAPMELEGGESRFVVWDHAEALLDLKGSGRNISDEEAETPSQKGNRLQATAAVEAAVSAVKRRSSQTQLYVLVKGALPRAPQILSAIVQEARRAGTELEFSKSPWYDVNGRIAHVQRIAQAQGLLLDDDIAGVLAAQLGQDDDGYQIEAEIRKLKLWQAETGEELDHEIVSDLCSHGLVLPIEWAKAVARRHVSRREIVSLTNGLIHQGTSPVEALHQLLANAREAYVFKTLEENGLDNASIASVLKWSNPGRCFFARKEIRTTPAELANLCEAAVTWLVKAQTGEVRPEDLRVLVSSSLSGANAFEMRQLERE